MKEYLVIDSTGCVNYYHATSRHHLIEQMQSDEIHAYVIREVNRG